MKYFIIGCGGVGSWAVPALVRLVGRSAESITLVDGDRLEKPNLDRQLFRDDQIGCNKAEALSGLYRGTDYNTTWFSLGTLDLDERSWLLVFADNHPARRTALIECDRTGCQAIIACNETTSSEAFYYQERWKNGPLDPRTYYPDIVTSNTGDPRQAVACTGEAQENNRQLVTANFMAAALAMHLLMIWQVEKPKLGGDVLPFLPFHLRSNMTKLETLRVCDRA